MSEKKKTVKDDKSEENTKTAAESAPNEEASAENAEKEKNESEILKAQADEYKDKWLRSVAEFDNYKKRNARLWQDAFNEGKTDVIVKILPIGDNLDVALGMITDESTAEGIRLLKRKYDETLAALGITEINPLGEKFDPNVAEAVMRVEKAEGEESDTVKQVFQKGYKLKDKIIRYAKVSVIG